jgi:hypothetical protein
LVQSVSSQEKELAEKNVLVAERQEKRARSGNLLCYYCAASVELSPFNDACYFFCHADVAKMESTLEGVKRGHTIVMEELNTQLRKSLAENSSLKEQLKDQLRIGLQKQKEVDDLRQAVIESENQRKGFDEVLVHF